ncbi:hypothetical protein [Ruegeria aquimaris]|uniref:Thermophilic metalloprotease (M29) n=1 Tax=Ruegeria aquimaris TaxID=2984333 RepID=A0ABT3AKC1_9RHOB|nr:hypothetical protein [Ruegeria sp. XHP0148]MCV2889140.1 hypothetical protein [Ruegeria sp. XHP0148]
MSEDRLRAGAENLLRNCGGLSAGDHLLIVQEEAGHGYYSDDLAAEIAGCAKTMGVETDLRTAPFDPIGSTLPASIQSAMATADRTLFLSRCGDQIRFSEEMRRTRPIVAYVLDTEMLASAFGRAHYDGFVEIKERLYSLLANAREIGVTCPLGTNFSGPGAAFPDKRISDVAITRFPMSVFAPVPAAGFSGVIVQDGFLVGTGSRFYQPYGCHLDSPIEIHFKDTVLEGFEGAPEDVRRAMAHFHNVGKRFGLNPMTVHSWHAGIHPGCFYTRPAAENFERWSGSAFGNPRLLHFHTCGNTAPGEISLNVLDPTIEVDGVKIWDAGVFHVSRVPGGAEILERYPCIRAVFENPEKQVGQGPTGRLSGV